MWRARRGGPRTLSRTDANLYCENRGEGPWPPSDSLVRLFSSFLIHHHWQPSRVPGITNSLQRPSSYLYTSDFFRSLNFSWTRHVPTSRDFLTLHTLLPNKVFPPSFPSLLPGLSWDHFEKYFLVVSPPDFDSSPWKLKTVSAAGRAAGRALFLAALLAVEYFSVISYQLPKENWSNERFSLPFLYRKI